MGQLDEDEDALLELLALKPQSALPTYYGAIAERLSQRGLVARLGATWVPTGMGYFMLGQLGLEWPMGLGVQRAAHFH
jgi:hypothetical protein